ncbi:hypothetical protein [Brachybacterium hainanense]|uniref:DUF559 domain-containing protein n=1 Tax=Brachybacterium hainanense TaxID=1541174 RepID=A0ABV6RE93_9MICO
MKLDPEGHAGLLLSRQGWLDRGFHPRDLAGEEFTPVLRGFHTPTDNPASIDVIVRTAQQLVLPGSVASFSTAALLEGIPLPWKLENGVAFLQPPTNGAPRPGNGQVLSVRPGASLRTGARIPTVHLRVGTAGSARTLRGITVHRMRPGPVGMLGDLRVSMPVEVLRELALILPWGDVVAAIDALLCPERSALGVTRDDIAAHAGRIEGSTGGAVLRDALGHSRERVRSYGETIMRLLIVGAGFPEPDPNLPVRDPRTGRRRYLDLAWEAAMAALEYDGDGHRVTKEQWRRDEARRDELASYGWTLARANGDDLAHPLRILLRLARTLGERGLAVPSEQRIRRYVASLHAHPLSLEVGT